MLRSCKYCGRVHDEQYICSQKSSRIKEKNYRHDTTADKFRRTMTWTNMSRRVRDRDHYMCLCCAAGICKDDGTLKTIEIENISVHHIIPLEEDYTLRLDETNLISVCGRHHEMCEKQLISRDKQRELVAISIKQREIKTLPCV